MSAAPPITRDVVASALHAGFIGASGTSLRDEDRTKVDELVATLDEVRRSVARVGKKRPVTLVDAAAGKGYVGVLAAKLVLEPLGRVGEIVLIERDASRLDSAQRAAERLGVSMPVRLVAADVSDHHAYPASPTLVVALHACGDATDRVLENVLRSGAEHALVVPCCVGKSTRGTALATRIAQTLGLPPAAPIQRRLVHSVVDGERVLRLEAAGYQTEVVELVPPRITPYNVLLRARRVGERGRAERSHEALRGLLRFGESTETK